MTAKSKVKQLIFLLALFSACSDRNGTTESAGLIPVAEFGESMAIGLSVNTGNRAFVSFPNADGDGYISLAVLERDQLSAYPDSTWNTGGPYEMHFLRVQD